MTARRAVHPLVGIARELSAEVERLAPSFVAASAASAARGAVAFVYNPLAYARAPHELYLERHGHAPKEVLLVGMNPGPFGMAQTGVPFGEVAAVRDWLGLEASVEAPRATHPKRPVLGFDCKRSEVSGARLWGWARDRIGTPERFFARFFVVNYCPLVFVDAGGRNVTPDKLPAALRAPLEAACDRALGRTVDALAPRHVVGVGAFAAEAARRALAGRAVALGQVLHPSPASPKANRGWAALAEAELRALGIALGEGD
ncbi:MAG: single-stranded DNA-binding protein [Myxococcales bacterium]|nr:single-stranded DNA-binding protein [Myxococcales bacterium]